MLSESEDRLRLSSESAGGRRAAVPLCVSCRQYVFFQEDDDIQLVTENGSDAATADSVIQSDGRTTLESVTHDDPQNTYPHSPSLHSPRGIAQDGREYDFNENNDLAVRYVQGISAELRFQQISANSGKISPTFSHFRRPNKIWAKASNI